jgi:hypothetical protein
MPTIAPDSAASTTEARAHRLPRYPAAIGEVERIRLGLPACGRLGRPGSLPAAYLSKRPAMKLSTTILCAAPWALIAQLTAAEPGVSAVLPRHGATTYVAEVVGRVIDIVELGQGGTETLVEVTGVTRNMLGQSAFDKMWAHCLISFTAGGGRSSTVGACRETDGDGDILFTSFDGTAGKLLGGTGKYAEMTGSAVFSVKPEMSLEAGKIAYSVNHDVTWAQK